MIRIHQIYLKVRRFFWVCIAHAYRFVIRRKADKQAKACAPGIVAQASACGSNTLKRDLQGHHSPRLSVFSRRKLTISLAVILIVLTVLTQLAPQLAHAATNSWGFGGDLTGYEYDAAKINIASSKASLANPGNVNGANMNLSPKSGVTSDGAAQFTAANKDYLTVNSNASLQTGDIDFEVGAWVYLDTTSGVQTVLSKLNTGTDAEYEIYIQNAKFMFLVSPNGTGSYAMVTANTFGALSISTWYFVRAWHDSVNNQIWISVNGTTDSTNTSSGVYASNASFMLGTAGTLGVLGSFLNGRIDSAYFKKSISTSGEATALYNAGAGRTYGDLTAGNGLDSFKTALTSWWDLNEESGTRMDAKGANHLTSTAVKLIDPATYDAEMVTTNPGFETAGTGGADVFGTWTDIPGSGAIVDETTLFHGGAHAAKMTYVTGQAYSYQDFTVTAGASYYLAFWTRGDGTNAGRYSVYDVTHSANIVSSVTTGIAGTTYTLFSTTFTAPAGCVSAKISVISPSVAGSGYFDDVSLKNITYAGLLNGGLDTWTTATDAANWGETVAGTSTINDEQAAPYSGSHAARFDVDASNSNVNLFQTVLTAGKRYKTTFWAKADSGTPTIKVGTTAAIAFNITLSNAYAQYTGYFTADVTNFMIARLSAASRSIYIDQVTLESIGPLSNAGIAGGTSIEGNYALNFDGTTSYVTLPNDIVTNANIRSNGATYSAWVKMMGTSNEQRIVGQKISSGYSDFSSGGLGIGSDNKAKMITYDDNVSYKNIAGSTVMSAGMWYLVTGTYNSADSKMRIYVNGSLEGTQSDTIATFSRLSANQANTIGKQTYTSSNFFNGTIDGVRIYNRALTGPEVTDLYNNTPVTTSLVSQWDFEEGAGTNAIDSVSAKNGTISGAVYSPGNRYYEGAVRQINDLSGNSKNFTQTTQTKRPVYRATGIGSAPAMQFDGVDDALVKTGDQIGTGNVTVTAVIKPRGWGAGNVGTVIDNGKYMLRLSNSGYLIVSSNASTVAQSAASSIALDTSYVISITRTSAGTTNIYINGAISGSTDQSSGAPSAGSDTYIGNNSGNARAFDGWLGPVMTFGSILGDSERNQVEKSLGATYGVTVASTAGTATASPYPTLSTKSPFHYTALQNFTENLGADSTGTMRYQISNDPTPNDISTSTWYWYNGASWTAADKFNGWQGNTAAEVDANIGTFHFVAPANSLKMRAFFVTDGVDNPILSSIDTTYVADTQAPDLTTLLSAKDSLGGSTSLTTNEWGKYPNPSFVWNVPADPSTVPGESSSGLAGYLVYWGTDNTADIDSASVVVGQDRVAYHWQTGTTYTSSTTLTTGSAYYLKVIPVDNAGNAHMTGTPTDYNLFTYKYDNVNPSAPLYTSVTPSGYTQTNHFVFNWPVVGGSAAVDTGGSGLNKYQYRIGTVGVWTDIAGDATTSSVTLDNAAALGLNTFNLTAVDSAGNQSNQVRTNFYFNNTAPVAPANLSVTPTNNTTNQFEFDWDASPGEIAGYYYSVNAIPTLDNASWSTGLSLASGAYATQQGANIMYVVAKDNAGNYDFSSCSQASVGYNPNNGDTCAAVAFTAVTSAPGIPGGVTAFDITNRDKQQYTVAVKYHQPDYTGTGFAGYDVYRSTDNVTFAKIGTTTSTTYLDDNLTSQLYYYYAVSRDNAGQLSVESSVVSITPTGRFTTPCVLVSGPTFTINPTSIDVKWATDRECSSFVEITSNGTFVSEQGSTTQVTDHEVKVVGLKSQNTYNFNIRSTDIDGNTLTGADQIFSTANNPSVYDMTVDNLTQSSAIINFKSTAIANFTLYYGETANYGTRIIEGSNSATANHSLAISNLKPGTMYYFRVAGSDSEGNELRSENSFTTLPIPVIKNFAIEPVKDAVSTTLKVTWETNVGATTVLKYALDAENYKEKSSSDLVTDHEIVIDNLTDQHTYTLYAQGMDQFGNIAQSDRVTFDTPKDSRPPKITDVVIESSNVGNESNKAQVAVSWKTDELSTSYIEYGVGISGDQYTNKTNVDGGLTNRHLVIISDLEPGRPYHLRVVSADEAGNSTVGTDNTVITGDVSKSALQLILNTLMNIFGWMGKLIK